MKDKLKIAVFHNLPQGGALRILYDHIYFLKNEGHYVDIYSPETSRNNFSENFSLEDNNFIFPVKKGFFRNLLISILNFLPLNLPIIDNARFSISFNNVVKVQKEIADDINKKDYDVVFVEQDGLFSYSPAILKYLKKPFVYYCQQPMRSDEITNILNFRANPTLSNPIIKKIFYYSKKKWMELDKKYSKYSNYTLANSYYSHESILTIHGKNSYVSYLGVDVENYRPKMFCRENFIIAVGAVVPDKGYDFIIRSLAKIDNDMRPELYIVGYSSSDTWLNYLKDLANDNNVKIKFFNNVSNEKLSDLYNKAKLSVFAPYVCPFGLVFLEAMACGTPVVSVKEGGVREVIKHNENGLLVPRDEELFSKAITNLLNDVDLWNEISINSVEYVNEFWTTKHAGERLLNHLYSAINKYKN